MAASNTYVMLGSVLVPVICWTQACAGLEQNVVLKASNQ